MKPINKQEDLEIVNPVESKEFPGYFIIPDITDYVINKSGDVLKIRTKQIMTPNISPYNYAIVGLTVNGDSKGYRLHRIIAIVFVGRPSRHVNKSFDELHVNHIDGNKRNNNINNLEWCTNEENVKHAWIHNLTNCEKPVLVRNIITNEVTELRSAREFCRQYGVSENYISELLLSKQSGKVTVNWCVFKYKDDKPWPEVPFVNQIEDSLNRISYWCASNQDTGKVVVSENLRELAIAMDMSFCKLNKAYYDHGGKLGDWIITMKREYSKIDSIERVLRRSKKKISKIKSTNIATGEVKIHDNGEVCARDLGIKDGKGISYAVLHRSGKPYYGYTFEKSCDNSK